MTRSRWSASASSRKSMSLKAAVPRMTRVAPASTRGAHRLDGAQAAADLDRHVDLGGDPPHVLEVGRSAAAGAVEVDDVQAAGAGLHPAAGGLRADRRRSRCAGRSPPAPAAPPCRPGCRSPGGGSRGRGPCPPPPCAARAAQLDEAAQQPQPVPRGLLGMELDAEHVVAGHDRGKPLAVDGASPPRRPRSCGPGHQRVHVVERATARAAGRGQRRRPLERRPRSSRCAGSAGRRSATGSPRRGSAPGRR